MSIDLYDHQKEVLNKLKTGSILVGGVGSGKSITSLAYYYINVCGGKIKTNGVGGFSPMKKPKDLYIITTARKRDDMEWEKDMIHFNLTTNPETSVNNVKVTIDSWNNIHKYVNVKNAFFIFDEQRVVGYGVWSISFIKLAKKNPWILLSATPGDTWMDYMPVFIANGFYKNKTDFERQHVMYNLFIKYKKVERYVEVAKLIRLRDSILIKMNYQKQTKSHNIPFYVDFDKESASLISQKRWNIFENKPLRDAAEFHYVFRKLVNSDPSRKEAIKQIHSKHKKLIIFYNFDYELFLLREMKDSINADFAEWNGHRHEPVPTSDSWIYLVQYTAGAEGWNCITTDTVIFYSATYSYKQHVQAGGRIDRINTPYSDLYYYQILSKSYIDFGISKALSKKKNFNESKLW